jgi:uncharacterized protein (DUF58 family)
MPMLRAFFKRDNPRTITPTRFGFYLPLVLGAGAALLVLTLQQLGEKAALAQVLTISKAMMWVVLGFLGLDFFGALVQPRVKAERKVAGSVAVNRWFNVAVKIQHRFMKRKTIELYESISSDIDSDEFPLKLPLRPAQYSQCEYRLRARERGPICLAAVYVRVPSSFGLWRVHYRVEIESNIKVYPDFSAISAYTILATDNHASQLGIKRKPKRGEGMDFMQLRDYRRGDSLRQVDWKATARRRKIISKEYQDERDQQVLLLIDSGRRMRAQDDNLNHFDHALNAALLVSYIALRQGDSVGVMAFGQEYRWLAPQKSPSNMKVLLNGLYDLQTSNVAPDYVMAAQKLEVLQRKRSLVIIVTNSRDEDIEEVLIAAKLLRKKHLVIIANIREQIVEDMQSKDVNTLDDALGYASASHYLTARRETQKTLVDNGVLAIDCLSKELPVRVANSYLEVKRAGVL